MKNLDLLLDQFAFGQGTSARQVDLTLNKIYIVYGTRTNDLGKFYLVLTDEFNTKLPWWMPAGLFEVVDDQIPESWQVDTWEGYGHESVKANPVFFDATLDIEDGTQKGYEVFEVMRKDAENLKPKLLAKMDTGTPVEIPQRQDVINLAQDLIDGRADPIEVARWAQQFYRSENKGILVTLQEKDPLLEEFLGDLILVDAKNGEGGLYYTVEDLSSWLDKFIKKTNKGSVS